MARPGNGRLHVCFIEGPAAQALAKVYFNDQGYSVVYKLRQRKGKPIIEVLKE